MANNILLKKTNETTWIYDSSSKEYSLTIDGTVVVIIDQYGNLKIKGRTLKI